MAYETDRRPHEIDLYAVTLEDPRRYRPDAHTHVAERLDWFDVKDDLPRHPRSGYAPFQAAPAAAAGALRPGLRISVAVGRRLAQRDRKSHGRNSSRQSAARSPSTA